MNGGLFSVNYASYRIITHPLNWECQRRYSEFEWLRNYLVKTNPGCYVKKKMN